jgi:hypothetical protein
VYGFKRHREGCPRFQNAVRLPTIKSIESWGGSESFLAGATTVNSLEQRINALRRTRNGTFWAHYSGELTLGINPGYFLEMSKLQRLEATAGLSGRRNEHSVPQGQTPRRFSDKRALSNK